MTLSMIAFKQSHRQEEEFQTLVWLWIFGLITTGIE